MDEKRKMSRNCYSCKSDGHRAILFSVTERKPHIRWWWLLLFILVLSTCVVFFMLPFRHGEPGDDVEIPRSELYRLRESVRKKKHAKVRVYDFAYPYDFGEIFSERKNWLMSMSQFLNAFEHAAFEVSSSAENSLYVFDTKGLCFFGEDVQEARVEFTPAKRSIAVIELVLYGSGNVDAHFPWSEMRRIWEHLIVRREEATAEAGSERDYGKDGRVDIVNRAKGFPAIEYYFGYQQHEEEKEVVQAPSFICVTMTPRPIVRWKGTEFACMSGKVRRHYNNLNPEDVAITRIPMVNQGQRGYCSVATLERIMRYYGLNVSMHEFAMLAGSKRSGGTSMEGVERAVGDVCKKFGMKSERLAYNPFGGVYASKGAFDSFTSNLVATIDAGLPVYWSVDHRYSTPDDVLLEDHARLIVGYNDKTAEIVYSDTWGSQHEFKHKNVTNAWIMTKYALKIDPRGRTDANDSE